MNDRRRIILISALLLICGLGMILILMEAGAPVGPATPPDRPVDEESAVGGLRDEPGGGMATGESSETDEDDAAAEGKETGADEAAGEAKAEPFSFEDETEYSVTVRLVDAEGKPVDGKVHILFAGIGWDLGKLPDSSEGVFRGHLRDPARYAALADRDGTRRQALFEISDEAPAAEVTITFAGSGTISGRIFTTAGSLAEDRKSERRVFGQSDLEVELIPDLGSEPRSLLSCLVGEDGTYRLSGVPEGAYLVRVGNKFHVSRVEVAENEHVIHDIRLGAGRIFGRVTDHDTGEPLEDVQVVLQLSREERVRTELRQKGGFGQVSARLRPDAEGRFEFANLPAGDYVLFSNGVEYAPLVKTATLGSSGNEVSLEFPLSRGSAVNLTITDTAGNPVQTPFFMTQGIRSGYVGEIGGLRAGSHEFIATGLGYEVQILKNVVFLPGEPTPLTFRLEPEVPTRLVFHDPDGQPVAGVKVTTQKDGRDLQRIVATFLPNSGLPFGRTGPKGYVWIRGFAVGAVPITARISGFKAVARNVELKPGLEEIVIVLEPSAEEFRFRIRVARVIPGGQADLKGVLPGDVLLTFDGAPLDSTASLAMAMEAAKARGLGSVKLVLSRDGVERGVVVSPDSLGVLLEEFEE
jgi:Carboxypeptidase regulatory-like domain